jgi:hypothetical protein
MQADPMEEWRRLTALYGEMGEIEIREFADQINDLTPAAQQVLRDEMKKRGITERTPITQAPVVSTEAAIHYEPVRYRYARPDAASDDEEPHDYSWKTLLCECETQQQVWQLAEALRRAGIDTWVDRPYSKFSERNLRVMVAADQLDQASVIAAQPIPQDIINQVKELDEVPPYQIPVCPKCGATDPTLESVEPSNSWLCESCGHTWSDPVSDASSDQQPAL